MLRRIRSDVCGVSFGFEEPHAVAGASPASVGSPEGEAAMRPAGLWTSAATLALISASVMGIGPAATAASGAAPSADTHMALKCEYSSLWPDAAKSQE